MKTSFNINLTKVAEIQLAYRTKIKASERPKIATSRDAYEILMYQWDPNSIEHVEEFKILLINHGHKALGLVPISKGGVSGTIADPKVIFSIALKANASALILAHNHPSGNLKPSNADIKLTHQLLKGGELLGIKVLDHLIVTKESYFSLADEGHI